MVAKSPQDYLDRAEECERLALNATTAEVRAVLRDLADRWRGMAAAEADRTNSDKSSATRKTSQLPRE